MIVSRKTGRNTERKAQSAEALQKELAGGTLLNLVKSVFCEDSSNEDGQWWLATPSSSSFKKELGAGKKESRKGSQDFVRRLLKVTKESKNEIKLIGFKLLFRWVKHGFPFVLVISCFQAFESEKRLF